MRTRTIITAALTLVLLALSAAPSNAGFRFRFDRSALRNLSVGIPPRLIDREAIELAISESNSALAIMETEALLDIQQRTDATLFKIQEMAAAGVPHKVIRKTVKLDRRLINARANRLSIDASGAAGEGVAAVRLAGGTGEDEWDIRWTSYRAQESTYGFAKDANKAIKITIRLVKQGQLAPSLDPADGTLPPGTFQGW